MNKRISVGLLLAFMLFCAPAQAQWYLGGGINGLLAEREDNDRLSTQLGFFGPRIYGGYRFNDWFALEAEVGKSGFRGQLWTGLFDVKLDMWNVALSGLVYLPLDGPIQPFVYAGAGRSYWTIDSEFLRNSPNHRISRKSSFDFYWHIGFGAEAKVGENLKVRIGYRSWTARIDPPRNWPHVPNEYRYRRRALDVSVHWAFGAAGKRPSTAERSGHRLAANSGRWYLGGGINGLHSEREDNNILSAKMDFSGPRLYGGYRFNDWFALEAEAGKASFRAHLWTDIFDVKLDMWNVALSGLVYLPLDGLVQPFAHAGAGRSYWTIDAKVLGNPTRHSSSDLYWHLGFGAEARVDENLRIRIGYRSWTARMKPPSTWAVSPKKYRYRRRALDVSVHWAF